MILIRALFCCLAMIFSFQPVYTMESPQRDEGFDTIKSLLLNFQRKYPQQITSFSERRKFGYNGQLIPIINGRIKDSLAQPLEDACIIAGAQPSAFLGFWYLDSQIFSTRFFFRLNNAIFGGEIEERSATREDHARRFAGPDWEYTTGIRACCTAYDNQLAILWEDRPHRTAARLFITLAKVDNLIKGHKLNLDEGKIEIKNQLPPLYQP